MTAERAGNGLDRRSRGQLWIYLGAAPGVGKARAMLAGARSLQALGRDVVIASLAADAGVPCAGFEFIGEPIDTNGSAAQFDVERILRRQPGLCLVDRLAHKNPEGARHRHRWQDVQEILDNGIDVHATLDVLNLESLLEAVLEVVPSRVREWVPDTFFSQASEVIFVDLPPQMRLERAADEKQPSGNPDERPRRDGLHLDALIALRNLALQCALEHNERRRLVRGRQLHADHSPEIPKVLVYLDNVSDAESLLHAGKRVAAALHAGWIVAYRETADRLQTDAERARLQYCLQLAEQLGAEVFALAGYATGRRIADLVVRHDIGSVVLENATRTLWQGRHTRVVLRTLKRQARGVDIVLISPGRSFLGREPPTRRDAMPLAPAPQVGRDLNLRSVIWSVAIPALATVVSTTLFRHSEPTNYLIIYLLGVLYLATRHGFWPSAIAAVLSVLASDFLLITPVYSFAVARPEDLVTLTVFLSAAILASRLADNLRFQSERAQQREQQVRFLYEFTNALADVRTASEVIAVASRRISREFGWPCQLLLADNAARIQAQEASAGAAGQDPFDLALAQAAFDSRASLGWGAGGRNSRADALYLPVSGAAQRFGVLAVGPARNQRTLPAEQRRMIDSLVSQIAQCLERMRLANEAQAANALAQTESLRNSLLNSIAHDFRTPLASIVAASSTLARGPDRLQDGQAQELAQSILEEGQRMAKLANNTLEMARLEAGNVRLQREWYPLDEVVGAAVTRMRSQLSGRSLQTRLPEGVPMAQVDAVMIVQVLENLIENALKYTPPGAPLEIGAEEQSDCAVFWVADGGPGIPPGEEVAIFEKFYQGRKQESRGGVGLGLTICRIIVTAHGGQIGVRNRPAGGAEFRFTIPCTQERPRITTSE